MISNFAGSDIYKKNLVNRPDCLGHVGYDMNTDLPGFSYQNSKRKVCIPFSQTKQKHPVDYQGKDFYIEEFTDAKIKKKWQEFSQDPIAAKSIIELAKSFALSEFRKTGTVSSIGKIVPYNDVNLLDIRRPAFFGQSIYRENIAKVDQKTYIVEFTVPRDAFEKIHLKKFTPIKLRGWFIKGDGIPDKSEHKTHVIVIMIGGRSIETTAIHHPKDPLYVYESETKKYKKINFPNKRGRTEKWGLRQWRENLYAFNQVGFDILTVDKRGHGISGGLSASDTGEQAEDLFRMLNQLESGKGLRVLTPTGEMLSGNKAAEKLLQGSKVKKFPIVIGGSSQGSIVASLAM